MKLTIRSIATIAPDPSKDIYAWDDDLAGFGVRVKPSGVKSFMRNLTKEDVERFQADVTAGKSATDQKTGFRGRAIVSGGKGAAARSLAALSAMLEFGVTRKVLTINPAKGVKLYKGEKKERPLVQAEVSALARGIAILEEMGMIGAAMGEAIKLLLLTGCRKNEVASLRWSYVDFERSCLRLPDSKTGAKVVPLAAAALKLLDNQPRTSDWMFPSTRSDGPIIGLQKAWEMVRVWCGIEDVRIHDLRHSFATFALSDGASLYLVGKALGHKQSRTTERYAHAADDPVKAVADRTASRLALLMDDDKEPGDVVPLRRR